MVERISAFSKNRTQNHLHVEMEDIDAFTARLPSSRWMIKNTYSLTLMVRTTLGQ